VNRHDATDEQWEGLADVVPLRGRDTWPGHPAPPEHRRTGEEGHDGDPRRFIVLRVQCFSDAREVAESIVGQVPVLVDLTAVEADVAKRVLDFAGGVVFGLGARMHRVDTDVFLLTPDGTEVERPRLGRAAVAGD
jgi:SepF-like predicted cell division protein (DUF552 family)